MSTNEVITVVTVCDNQFTVLLAALIKSIELNHRSSELIHLYIVNDGISERNANRIEQVADSDKIKIIWKKMEDAIPNNLKLPLDNTTFPANTYARICIPYFIDENANKAIYMDVDMIILKDISELWRTPLEGYAVAAATDRSEVVSSEWGGIKNYKELGLPADSGYFNSGLLVMDTRKWMEAKIAERAFKCAAENVEFISFADQYSLNVVLNQQWKMLDPRWNAYAQNNISDPYLIHFTGMKPIFKGYSGNAGYKEHFFYYLNQTPWADFTVKSNVLRLAKKLYNKVMKRINRGIKYYL